MYSMVKEYLKQNAPLIYYVRDEYGYSMGVVVAVGKDRLGWSMVNRWADCESKRVQPHQLPVVQRILAIASKEGVPFDIFSLGAVRKLIRNNLKVSVPNFNREEGLRRAIETAERGEVKVSDSPDMPVFTGKVPCNPLMINALDKMLTRSRRVQRFA